MTKCTFHQTESHDGFTHGDQTSEQSAAKVVQKKPVNRQSAYDEAALK